MIRLNPELQAILAASQTRYAQVRALDTALTANKRVKAKRHSNAATPQADVWATGTLFRDAALVGAFTFQGPQITKYGSTSDLTTCLAADLASGKSVLRIEGGGHWIEGTLGLAGSGADFIFPTNPTVNNSIAIGGSFDLRANQLLPDGTPDTTAPVVSLVANTINVTSQSGVQLTATATDNKAVAKVEFYRDGALRATVNAAPWVFTDTPTFLNNGSLAYTAKAYDAAGNSAVSTSIQVTINIPEVIETGPVTLVGNELTSVSFKSTATTAQNNVPVTFGQPFELGALPAMGAAVELVGSDNSVIPCQLDVKTTNRDGSVRFGILSAILPVIGASANTTYAIVRKAAPIGGATVVPANNPGLNATILLTDTGAGATPTAGTLYTADAAPKLAAGQYTKWLEGPIASEWHVVVPLVDSNGLEHPDLHVRFNIRGYAGISSAKVDYIVENTWVKEANTTSGLLFDNTVSVDSRVYKVSVKSGENTVYTRTGAGYVRAKFDFNPKGAYDGEETGVPNDGTVYTATITVDGVVKPISVVGSDIQTYGQLRAKFNTQLGGMATCVRDSPAVGFRFTSASTGANSSVQITDSGSLFPALMHVAPYRPMDGGEYIHYPKTGWKKTYWYGNEPKIHVANNMAYLMSSKAVPNYAPELTGDPGAINTLYNAMKANEDMGSSGVTKSGMADVGAAPGIGILPEWAAMCVVSQDEKAKYVTLKQGDLHRSWPTFFRDKVTSEPISFSKYPYASISGNTNDSTNPETKRTEIMLRAAENTFLPDNRNTPDVAHHPDMSYLPYLLTGDHYYLESLLFYQRYCSIVQVSEQTYRNGRKCLWNRDQPRGQAWMARTAAHTWYILPDGHWARAEIEYEIDQNMLWYEANYVSPSGKYHNPFGFFYHGYGLAYSSGNAGAPWQDDFITAALGRGIELGVTRYAQTFNFKAKCVAGRMTSGADFCWQAATVFSMRFRANSSSPLYTTWKEVYDNSIAATVRATACGSPEMAAAIDAAYSTATGTQNAMLGYPASTTGYPANMQPAVAYCATHNAANGDEAQLIFENRAEKPNYNMAPQFAIVPRI